MYSGLETQCVYYGEKTDLQGKRVKWFLWWVWSGTSGTISRRTRENPTLQFPLKILERTRAERIVTNKCGFHFNECGFNLRKFLECVLEMVSGMMARHQWPHQAILSAESVNGEMLYLACLSPRSSRCDGQNQMFVNWGKHALPRLHPQCLKEAMAKPFH